MFVLGTAIKERVDDLSDIRVPVTQFEIRLFKYSGVAMSRTLNVRMASLYVTPSDVRRAASEVTEEGAPHVFVSAAAALHEPTSSADDAAWFYIDDIDAPYRFELQ